ncbi:MAG: lipoprotein, partial [Shewanellaceae bacterium]|nr:lipoprotein [Shewanellaceae bacterium]
MKPYCILLALAMLLQACGHKGPLYLPDTAQPNKSAVGTLPDSKYDTNMRQHTYK